MGVGKKVADCITLFSLDKPSCIPVDTHVFQIAKRFKFTNSKLDSVNDKVYEEINTAFVNIYGDKAGWAH